MSWEGKKRKKLSLADDIRADSPGESLRAEIRDGPGPGKGRGGAGLHKGKTNHCKTWVTLAAPGKGHVGTAGA